MVVKKIGYRFHECNLTILHVVDVFSKIVFALFGVYVWELSVTSDFEWSLITGRRRFRWPLASSLIVLSHFLAETSAEYSYLLLW
jgi:hypothetical protein